MAVGALPGPAREPAISAVSLDAQDDVEMNISSEASGVPAIPPKKILRRLATDNPEIRTKAAAVTAAFKRPALWVMVFGWSLALCAGIVNAAGYHAWGVYATHVTGSTTAIGLRIEGAHGVNGKVGPLTTSLALIASFFAGACACGFLIDKNHVHFGVKAFYGVALIGNAMLLVLAVLHVGKPLTAMCCVAAACGLQNAMCTSHFGAVIRTTHVTGTLTDIGSNTGRIAMICLRKGLLGAPLNALERAEVTVDAKKIMVLLPMWCSFLLGGIIGAFLSAHIGIRTLLVPATVTFLLGMFYVTMRGWLKDRLKGMEKERLTENVSEVALALRRTCSVLHTIQEAEGSAGLGSEEAAAGLDEEFDEVLEAVREMEVDLARLCQQQRQRAAQHADSGRPARKAGTTLF